MNTIKAIQYKDFPVQQEINFRSNTVTDSPWEGNNNTPKYTLLICAAFHNLESKTNSCHIVTLGDLSLLPYMFTSQGESF